MASIRELAEQQSGTMRTVSAGDIAREQMQPQGFFWKALDIISRPSYAVNEGIKNVIQGESFVEGLQEGITGRERTVGSDVLAELGWRPEGIGGKIARGVAGFAADVVTDPLNFIIPMAGAGIKATGRGALKGVKGLRTSGETGRKILAGGLKARRAVSDAMDTGFIKTLRRAFDTDFVDVKNSHKAEQLRKLKKGAQEQERFITAQLNQNAFRTGRRFKDVANKYNMAPDELFVKLRDGIEARTLPDFPEAQELKNLLEKQFDMMYELDKLNGIARYGKHPDYIARILTREAREKLQRAGIDPDALVRSNEEGFHRAVNAGKPRSTKTAAELEKIAKTRGFQSPEGGFVKVGKLFEDNIDQVLYRRGEKSAKGVGLGEFSKGAVKEFGYDAPRVRFAIKQLNADDMGDMMSYLNSRALAQSGNVSGIRNTIGEVSELLTRFDNGMINADKVLDGLDEMIARGSGEILDADKAVRKSYLRNLKSEIEGDLLNRVGIRKIDTGRALQGIAKADSPIKEALDNTYFKKDVANEIERALGLYNPQSGIVDKVFKSYFDPMLNMFKRTTLAYFPSYYVRNMATNEMLLYQAGLNPIARARHGADAFRLMKYMSKNKNKAINLDDLADVTSSFRHGDKANMLNKFDDIIEEVTKKNVVGDGFNTDLLADAMGTSSDKTNILQKMARGEKKVSAEALKRFGRVPEEWARLTLYMAKRDEALRKLGMGVDEASEYASGFVKKYLFDYSELTEFERKVMKRVFPFYTFYRKNLPLQAERFIKDPTRFRKLQIMRDNLSEDMTEGERKTLPDYLGKGSPIKINDNLYVTLKDWMPQTNLTDFGASEALNMVNPIVSTVWETAKNYNSFYNTPIKDPTRQISANFLGGLVDEQYTAHVLSKIRAIKLMNDIVKDLGRRNSRSADERKKAKKWFEWVFKDVLGVPTKVVDMEKMKGVRLAGIKASRIALRRQYKKQAAIGDRDNIRKIKELDAELKKDAQQILRERYKPIELD